MIFIIFEGAQLINSQAALQQQQQQQQHGQQQQPQAQQQPQQQQLSYSVIPQMQTVNIDGQDALFIPSSPMTSMAAHHQSSPTMQFTTASGQQVQLASQQVQLANGQTIITPQPVSLIRAPNVFPTSIIQNIGGQTVQLPTGLFLQFYCSAFLPNGSLEILFNFIFFQQNFHPNSLSLNYYYHWSISL